MTNDIKVLQTDLAKIIDLENILSLEFIEEDKLAIKILVEESSKQDEIKTAIIKLLKIDHQIPKVKFEMEVKKPVSPFVNTNKILISSGKGGVGKSCVTANLANAMQNKGYRVAIIDADIYGSSIPLLFDLTDSPTQYKDKITPMYYENIELIGTANVNPNDEPIVWRGPMLGRLLNSFFNDVAWSHDIDYLLIDLPPGTGDVPLDLNNIIPEAKSIIVTTPNVYASTVAIKAGEISKIQNHEIIGVIENMSYYDYHGEQLAIFGSNGGQLVADTLETELLVKLPIIPTAGSCIYDQDTNIYNQYMELVKKIEKHF